MRENPPPAVRPAHVPRGGFWAGPNWDDYEPTDAEIDAEVAVAVTATLAVRRRTAKQAVAKPARTVDPRLVAMARELRDRWTEEVAAGTLGVGTPAGKYALTRDPATTRRPGRMALTGREMAALPLADGPAVAA